MSLVYMSRRTILGRCLDDGRLRPDHFAARAPLVRIVPLEALATKELVADACDPLDPPTCRKLARRLRALERLLLDHGLGIDVVQLRDAKGRAHVLALRSDWRDAR